jgi:regulatory protein
MPVLTGLRRIRPGRVELQVDGRPWRTVPDEVVVSCSLAAGRELERPLLRELRRELRRVEALAVASRALARRDLSRRRLGERLRAGGVAERHAEAAVAALATAGAVDDERLARVRAQAFAERGWGDAAVEAKLQREGVDAAVAAEAVAALPPERGRARTVAASASDARKAWALLGRRGFAADTIEDVLGVLDAD